MPEDDSEQTSDIFPAGTKFCRPQGPNYPDDSYWVAIGFPDENSAILFFEWCRQLCIDAEGSD